MSSNSVRESPFLPRCSSQFRARRTFDEGSRQATLSHWYLLVKDIVTMAASRDSPSASVTRSMASLLCVSSVPSNRDTSDRTTVLGRRSDKYF